ncbi:MAG TPA: histidine kinase [Solirubrobacteraceae bacterium]
MLLSAPSSSQRTASESEAYRRKLILGGAAALFVSIFVVREISMSQHDALSVLYVIPVAIVALELGLRAGLIAAVGASAAVAIWLATRQLPFALAPLAVRASILVSVGVIAGWFSDQMHATSAAAAIENERLLAVEREQASLQAEVDRMRRRLGDQLRNAARVIERQEQERRGIARQLHEEAAQAMAAALLTVGLLERGSTNDLTRAQFDDVRSQVRSSIADLRRIASSLRPAVLDEMGLASALNRIAEVEAEHNARAVSFSTDGLDAGLSREAEASTYRVIEEVLSALGRVRSVEVDLSTRQEMVQIVIEAHSEAHAGNGLAGDGLAGDGLAGDGFAGNGFAGSGHAGNSHAGSDHASGGFADDGPAGEGVPASESGLLADRDVLAEGFAVNRDVSAADVGESGQVLVTASFEEQRLRADLLATRARVELIGGSLHVGSLLGDGSRIVAELPLNV